MACSCLISSHRTANPSIALLSQGGLSRSATISSPRTRPNASRIEIFSRPNVGVDSNTIRCASCNCVSPSAAFVAFTVAPLSMRLPGRNVHEGPAFLAERFDLIRNLVITLGCSRVGIEHGKGLAGIGLDHNIGVEWNPSEERHTHIHRGGFSAAFAEHFNMVVTMGTLQPAHIFDNPNDRDFAVFAERDRLA